MVIRVREAGSVRGITVPCPLGLARFVVALIPQRVFDNMMENAGDRIPEEDREEAQMAMSVSMDKRTVMDILDAVGDVAREFKGLEIVHVESADGDRVSICL